MKQAFLALLVVIALQTPVTSQIAYGALRSTSAKESQAVEHQLRDIERQVFCAPVDARVDRIWHAIPGLCGSTLDFGASLQKTMEAHDGKIHPIVTRMPPKTRLRDLPPEPIYRGPSAEKSVCLMFNVSGGEEYIPSILHTLQSTHTHATFFLDGAWVQKHPDLAKQIAADGHAIGSHGTGHPDFRRLSSFQLQQQVQKTNSVITETVGETPRLLAPPAGSYDNRTVKIARTHGMYTILWTADTIDWKRPPASMIVTRAVNGAELGAFILMHPTQPTASALSKLIRSIVDKGYQFKTVEQVVDEVPLHNGSWYGQKNE